MSDPRPERLKIVVAQLNPILGDVKGNAAKAKEAWESAREDGADLVVFSELFLCGYPPEDLVMKPALQRACRDAAERLATETADGPGIVIGTPWLDGESL